MRNLNFRLPNASNADRQLWINAISKHQGFSDADDHTLSYRVCSKHFEPSLIKTTKDLTRGKIRKQLVRGSFPTIFPNKIGTVRKLEEVTTKKEDKKMYALK